MATAKRTNSTKAKEIVPEIFNGTTKLNLRDFFFKVLTGSAQGILIGVLPSAIMKNVLKFSGLMDTSFGMNFSAILTLFQSFIPLLIGLAIAMQFRMKALDVAAVAIATGAASSSFKWYFNQENPMTHKPATPLFIAGGAGDVINAMIVSSIAVLVIWLIAKYLNGFGSIAIIFTPLVAGLIGWFGLVIAPYVANVTTWIGDAVSRFTALQPVPMSILIAMAFSIIIITPVSTVGIALAISLAGLGAGAAGIGVVATTIVLLINSVRVNKPGVSIAIFLGAMKGMMPSVFKKPITMLPFLLTAAISAIPVALFNAQGTPQTAGFGYIGMVSPLQSFIIDNPDKEWITNSITGFEALIVWFVVPIIAAFISNYIFSNILKLYKPSDFQQDL